MAYTTIDDPSAYFHIQLYTGNNNTTQSITNNANSGDFQADWLWIKNRDNVEKHHLMDSSRGANKFLHSNENAAERTGSHASGHNDINSFSSNGFTITSNGSNDELNFGTRTYVAWQWKANGGTTTTNDASSTSIGNVDSIIQANTTAGFSIVTFPSDNTAGRTVAHGLGVAPTMIITKGRAQTSSWYTYHYSAGANKYLTLNSNGAAATNTGIWGNTHPTSTVFTIGNNETGYNNGGANESLAYCFAPIKGYSRFGMYRGNASADGTFVFTGFKPSFLMFKALSGTENWGIFDNKRNTQTGNPRDLYVTASTTNADSSESDSVDFLSNGFKWRIDSGFRNGDGVDFIYMAFAESPFASSEGVPTTAG